MVCVGKVDETIEVDLLAGIVGDHLLDEQVAVVESLSKDAYVDVGELDLERDVDLDLVTAVRLDIEHGLQHRKDGGNVEVRMKIDDECLMVEIEDDGIGREASLRLQKEKGKLHKSMGMHIVTKRVESLNKILAQKIHLEVIDLKTDEGNAAGTLVKICIPFRNT